MITAGDWQAVYNDIKNSIVLCFEDKGCNTKLKVVYLKKYCFGKSTEYNENTYRHYECWIY